MKITVVGLGKIGLPLAVQFALRGHSVIGCDINPMSIELINAGMPPFPGEANLDEYLQRVVTDGLLRASVDTENAVESSDVVVIAVPLIVDAQGAPDFQILDSATASVAEGLRPNTLICYETTLPVGATRQRFLPMLEELSTLSCGSDFYLVFSPERVLSGRIFEDLRTYPKLVGGIDRASTEAGLDFYSKVLDFDLRPDLLQENGVWDLGTCEAAEFAKLAETTYRDVNIGLANQFALHAEQLGIDVIPVIDACNSQPFSHIHRPGIAVGGHCIPVYPQLYLWGDADATIVSAARQANELMPQAVINRLVRELGSLKDLLVVVLGVSYRGGVKETAFSGAFPTLRALEAEGAKVCVHDPLFEDDELHALGLRPWKRGEPADVAILQADHAEYQDWCPSDLPGLQAILDGRRSLNDNKWEGVRIIRVGSGR